MKGSFIKHLSIAILLGAASVCYADSVVDTGTYNQIKQLYAVVQQYPQQLSASWIENTNALLRQDDNNFTFITTVCMNYQPCLSGPASFQVAAEGLKDNLHMIEPAVEACSDAKNLLNCVSKKIDPVVLGFVTGNDNQLIFQLQSYLQQNKAE